MRITSSVKSIWSTSIIFVLLLSSCTSSTQPSSSPITPIPTSLSTIEPTATPIPSEQPTSTYTPFPSSTKTPEPIQEPTSIPGVQVYPVSSLANGNPWLPLQKDKRPMTVFYGFNTTKPPFNNIFVRQAFTAAVDRELIAKQATGFKFRNVTPATSITPSETLGRNLYGQVGIPFNPAKAKELLKEAGYTSSESFPEVLFVVNTRGSDAPGAYSRIGDSIIDMWKTNLGIKVKIEVESDMSKYYSKIQADDYDIYQMGWGADYNDPDNFLNTLFSSNSEMNYGHFRNTNFDSLVIRASKLADPSERQLLYIQAEQILTEQETAVIPLFHTLYYQHK